MRQDKAPLISIIVPVYKVEKYIHRCIKSILFQTFSNFELILIDDGSPDKSGIICDEYAKKDKRIKVFHQKNGGVSNARNNGIEHAQGTWISFIDSDDYIEKAYYEHLIQFSNNDWIIGGFKTELHIEKLKKISYSETDFGEFWDSHFHRLYSTVPWGKLYKKEIIQNNHIQFDTQIRLGEDLIFNLEYVRNCKTIQLIDSSQYIYTTNAAASERYNLREDELKYIIYKVKELTSELNNKRESSCSPQLILRTIVGTYPLHTITSEKIEAYFSIYNYAFNDSTRTQFYNDEICSPIKKSIRHLKELASQKKYKEYRNYMSEIHAYFFKDLTALHYNQRTDSFIAKIIKHKLYRTLYFIMFIRRIK